MFPNCIDHFDRQKKETTQPETNKERPKKDFNYCQNNKAQWKNLRAFLKLLDTITGYLLFLFIYLFIYSFLVLINLF